MLKLTTPSVAAAEPWYIMLALLESKWGIWK
jgi:hypothetical protein